jgi:hypothetical protein
MNFKRQAKQLEIFLEEEFKKKIPLVILPDKSIVYKRYKIKQDDRGFWTITLGTGDVIDQFRIKTTATLAAKFYDQTNFNRYNEIKSLDTQYWNNSNDASFFKYRYENTNDLVKRDIFMWRWELADNRAKRCKEEISAMFKTNF